MSFSRRPRLPQQNRGRVLFGGAAAPFSPLAYGPLEWWRADMGITLNGSDVAAWAGQVAAFDLVQAAGAQQALYTASDADFNGHPSLTFTAANLDFMQCLTGGSSGNPVHSIFAVIRTGALGGTFAAYVNYGRLTTNTDSSVIGQTNANVSWFGGGGQTSPAGAALVANTKYRFGKTSDGTNTQGYRDGASDGAAAARTYTLQSPPGFLIGGRSSATGFANFSIPEWVVYPSVLSAPQIATLNDYFATRYGV